MDKRMLLSLGVMGLFFGDIAHSEHWYNKVGNFLKKEAKIIKKDAQKVGRFVKKEAKVIEREAKVVGKEVAKEAKIVGKELGKDAKVVGKALLKGAKAVGAGAADIIEKAAENVSRSLH